MPSLVLVVWSALIEAWAGRRFEAYHAPFRANHVTAATSEATNFLRIAVLPSKVPFLLFDFSLRVLVEARPCPFI